MASFSKIENNIVVKVIEVSDNVATTEQNGINFLKNLYKDSEAQWVQTFDDGKSSRIWSRSILKSMTLNHQYRYILSTFCSD